MRQNATLGIVGASHTVEPVRCPRCNRRLAKALLDSAGQLTMVVDETVTPATMQYVKPDRPDVPRGFRWKCPRRRCGYDHRVRRDRFEAELTSRRG